MFTAIASTPSGDGYWCVKDDGAIFGYGDAGYHGGANGTKLNAPIVDIAAHPSGKGYWLLGADGGIFGYGAAKFFGHP